MRIGRPSSAPSRARAPARSAATRTDRPTCRSRRSRRAASTPSCSARRSLITTTAAAPSEICDALPAVTVPSPVNAGRRPASVAGVVSGRIPSSRSNRTGVALGLRHVDTDDLVGETARLPRVVRSRVRSRGPRVLLLATDAELGVDRVGARSHVPIVERAPQPVMDHRVQHRGIAQTRSRSSLRQDERGVGHRLHAAGDRHLELPRADHLVGHRDGRGAGQADLVDRDRRRLDRDAGGDRRLPGGDLPLPGLQHVAHDRVLDLLRRRRRPWRGPRGSRSPRGRRRASARATR